MAGEKWHGGPMPDHRVDVLEPPSLSPIPDSEALVPGPALSSSSAVVTIQVKFSVLPRWTERAVGFNNMADRKNGAQRTYFWPSLMPSPFNLDKG